MDGPSEETAAAHHVANPSLGPSIGEMSLALTNSLSASGSHLDRVLREDSCDRDSASHRALAGASLSGSLSGSAAAGFQPRSASLLPNFRYFLFICLNRVRSDGLGQVRVGSCICFWSQSFGGAGRCGQSVSEAK